MKITNYAFRFCDSFIRSRKAFRGNVIVILAHRIGNSLAKAFTVASMKSDFTGN
jgi:hypothetical protein